LRLFGRKSIIPEYSTSNHLEHPIPGASISGSIRQRFIYIPNVYIKRLNQYFLKTIYNDEVVSLLQSLSPDYPANWGTTAKSSATTAATIVASVASTSVQSLIVFCHFAIDAPINPKCSRGSGKSNRYKVA